MTRAALTIAGSDSGGGAGIQADLKTFSAHGIYATTAATAVTAQNTIGVDAVDLIDPAMVYAQIKSIVTDIPVAAAKTGMLGNSAIVDAVYRAIRDFSIPAVVVDTVMVSKSGHRLLNPEAESALVDKLLPLAHIVTPNLPEAEVILGRKIRTLDAMKSAAADIKRLGPDFVFLKGGHLGGDASTDVLFDGRDFLLLDAVRIRTASTHGTGCTLSAAITANLASGMKPREACVAAKKYLTEAIRHAEKIGHGHGPVNHFWSLRSGGPRASVHDDPITVRAPGP